MKEIYIENFKRTRTTKIADLIHHIVNGSRNATYHDKDLLIQQCKSTANRSPLDIYHIVKTYFPTATRTKIYTDLYKLMDGSKSRFMYRCNHINKYVVFRSGRGYDYDRLPDANVFITSNYRGMDIKDADGETVNSLMKLFTS